MNEMYHNIIDLLKDTGLLDEYEPLNIDKLQKSKKVLKYCIDNEYFELTSFFNSDIWDLELVKRMEGHICSYINNNFFCPFPTLFLDNSKILNEVIGCVSWTIISKFTENAWNDENVLKYIDKYGNSFSVSKNCYPKIYGILIKNKLFDVAKNISLRDDLLTCENVEIIVNVLKDDGSLIKNINLRSPYLLRRLLEEKILSFADTYWDKSDWTDENIDLLCQLVEEDKIPIDSRYIFKFNDKFAPIILRKKMFQNIRSIDACNWTDENVEMFVAILDEYLQNNFYIPSCLESNSKILHKVLELHGENILNNFSEEAWNAENISLYFNTHKDITWVNGPSKLLSSEKKAALCASIGYINELNSFSFNNPISCELEDAIVKAYKNKIPNKVPLFLIENKSFLRKIIDNNELYVASIFKFGNTWDEELVKLYCNKLMQYNGVVSYDNFYLEDAYPELLLKTYILTNRFEGISTCSYKSWNGENKKLFKNIMVEYFDEYKKIPYGIDDQGYVLRYLLDIEDFDQVYMFKYEAWNKELFDQFFNYYKCGKIKNTSIGIIHSHIKDNCHLKYLKYNNIVSSNFESEFRYFKDILDENVMDKNNSYNSYVKFIQKINSFKIMLLILDIVDGDKNRIIELFDEVGPKQELIEKLIYDKDYILYCLNNNIEININNSSIKSYLEVVKKYPELLDYIILNSSNVSKYFSNDGVTFELKEFLFNVNAAEFLIDFDGDILNLDEKRKYILNKVIMIEDKNIKSKFFNYCKNNYDCLNINKIDDVYKVIKRIENSNSNEILRFKESLVDQVLNFDNPEDKLIEIENIFIKNNLPNVGKIFLVFKTLHSDYVGCVNSGSSPTLKKANNFQRDIIIFSDLIRIALGSNNRDFNDYLDSIVIGNKLYRDIQLGNKNKDELCEDEIKILDNFMNRIQILYDNTLFGKGKNVDELEEVKRLLDPTRSSELELPNRIVYLFCHAAGFDDVDAIKTYQTDKLSKREEYHKKLADSKDFKLHNGDYIKGINSLKYLGNILQNGSLCKEFLGDMADSDATPLDTDLSLINEEFSNNNETLNHSISNQYGNTFIVLKKDNNFNLTRNQSNMEFPSNRRNHESELFSVGFLGKSHYGVRTGFASSDIDYIVTRENPTTICLDIAMSGIYIPVADIDGKLIFSYNDYQKLRSKMQGLSYYGENNYEISNNVLRAEFDNIVNTLSDNDKDTAIKRNAIIDVIKKVIPLKIKTKADGDISPNSIEIIDTGSTGRGTNVYGDSDFDFIVRVDREIMLNPEKLQELKMNIASALGMKYTTGDFRFKNVVISGIDNPVDIDMTFITKTNKVSYTTEECIKDRLNTIRKQYPLEYDYVIANIIMAKKLLKKYECYKPKHAAVNPQGGLGGVGVENFVLQHGGSLYDAALDFLEKAKGKNFMEFQQSYSINDFGANHMADKNRKYPYDDYIYNLNENGYNKMLQAFNDYILGKVDFNEGDIKLNISL